MATKLERMATKLNDDFRTELAEAMRNRFGVDIESTFSIFDMRLHTARIDGEGFTDEQRVYLDAFSLGFTRAMAIVSEGL